MALTAARTELDIALVGQDETQRMLEQAKAKMAELEGKTKSLTAATKAQTAAAKESATATASVNGALGGLAQRISGPLEGIGKLKESISKGIEIFGFAGMAITGLVDGISFLANAFDDSAEKAAKNAEEMAKTKEESDRLKKATDGLRDSLNAMNRAAGLSGAALASQRAKLAGLRGDVQDARFYQVEAQIETEAARADDLTETILKNREKEVGLLEMISKEAKVVATAEKEIADIQSKAAKERAALKSSDTLEAIKNIALAKEIAAQEQAAVAQIRERTKDQREAVRLANANVEAIRRENKELERQREVQMEIVDATAAQLAEVVSPTGARDGGGEGGGRARGAAARTAEKSETEKQQMLRQMRRDFELDEEDEFRKHQRRLANIQLGDDNVQAAATMRANIVAELAKLPTDATAKAYEPLKAELQKQLKALDAITAAHVKMGIDALVFTEEQDKVIATWEKERAAIDQVKEAIGGLTETQQKAAEEAKKMRDELERAMPADLFEKFSGPLEQLGQIAAPAFEAVSQAVSGVTAQLAKYKDGQQSLTASLIGAGGAIAGQIAKNVDGVKAEATVRAAFETAMGFATLFSNPAASVGHFTAAAMFAGLATGVVKMPSSGGGQSAKDTKPAASTRDSGMGGGGGGVVTNVYNLQTGIIDGQSTAIAFRRAEQTARNTGMASAGGW